MCSSVVAFMFPVDVPSPSGNGMKQIQKESVSLIHKFTHRYIQSREFVLLLLSFLCLVTTGSQILV